MKKTFFGFTLGAVLLALTFSAEAQQPAKIPRIGFLLAGGDTDPSRTDAFGQGLRQLGYAEGKSIVIEWRRAEGNLDRRRTCWRERVESLGKA